MNVAQKQYIDSVMDILDPANSSTLACNEEKAAEVITDLILSGLRKEPKPSKMTRVKDFIYKCKWEIVFLQDNLGTEGFKSDWVKEDIKRYTRYLDINLDRLTALEIERLEKLNSIAVFPQSYMEIIIDARQSALDFYYSLDVEISPSPSLQRGEKGAA